MNYSTLANWPPTPAQLINADICRLSYVEKQRLIEILAAAYSRGADLLATLENGYPEYPWASGDFMHVLSVLSEATVSERLSILCNLAGAMAPVEAALVD